jgi:aminoglycoside 6'-N-acetyltransferase I
MRGILSDGVNRLEMKLQSMRREHLADCARLYVKVFNRIPWKGKWTVRTAAKHIRESFQDQNFRGIVALEENSLVGFAFGLIQQWENERRFYLKEMCVRGTKQRSGVGTLLLTHFIKKLAAENVRQISLGTERDTPAERFYLRLGFKVDPKTIIMKKRVRRVAIRR